MVTGPIWQILDGRQVLIDEGIAIPPVMGQHQIISHHVIPFPSIWFLQQQLLNSLPRTWQTHPKSSASYTGDPLKWTGMVSSHLRHQWGISHWKGMKAQQTSHLPIVTSCRMMPQVSVSPLQVSMGPWQFLPMLWQTSHWSMVPGWGNKTYFWAEIMRDFTSLFIYYSLPSAFDQQFSCFLIVTSVNWSS